MKTRPHIVTVSTNWALLARPGVSVTGPLLTLTAAVRCAVVEDSSLWEYTEWRSVTAGSTGAATYAARDVSATNGWLYADEDVTYFVTYMYV